MKKVNLKIKIQTEKEKEFTDVKLSYIGIWLAQYRTQGVWSTLNITIKYDDTIVKDSDHVRSEWTDTIKSDLINSEDGRYTTNRISLASINKIIASIEEDYV